jgi:excinuclease UvrABC ATPase subunit
MLDHISVHGARVHNLKNVSVEIPRSAPIATTGLHYNCYDLDVGGHWRSLAFFGIGTFTHCRAASAIGAAKRKCSLS